jgi:hypothetical protein
MSNFEKEYYLLYPSDIATFPLIYEDCKKLVCSIDSYGKCEKFPACPAYYKKTKKIENPAPFVMDFFTTVSKKEAVYADCYLPLSLSQSSFAVSPKLHDILLPLNIAGIQLIPVYLLEDGTAKYTDFWYVHTYNFLPVLSVKKSRYQEVNNRAIKTNLLEIKFNSRQMNKITLENRLIFRLPLARNYFLFHSSVAEELLSADPIGIQFIKVSDYSLPNTNGIFI